MKKAKHFMVGCLALMGCLASATAASSCSKKDGPNYGPVVRTDRVTDNGVYPILKPEYVGKVEVEMMSWTLNNLISPWSENKYFQRMEELTGMKIKFGDKIYDRETYGTKFSLCFNSETTMPDFFYKSMITRENELKFGKSGDLICLDGYIEEYCPNLKARMAENPMIRKMITCSDGHIYSLPTIYYPGTTGNNVADGYYFINKNWCEQISVDPASITTIEALSDVLTQFKNNDMNGNGDKNDETPMYLAGSAELYYLYGAFGYSALTWNAYVDSNNKVQIPAQEDNYKGMLSYLNGMYNNGLFNQNYIDRSTAHKWIELQNNRVGVFCDYSTEVAGTYGDQFVALPAMNSAIYTGPAFYPGRIGVDSGSFAITKKCQYPDVLMRWIDTAYDIDYSRWDTIGREGDEWQYDDATKSSWSFKVPVSQITYDRSIQFGGGLPGVEMTYDGFMEKSSDTQIGHSYKEIAKIQPKVKTGVPSLSLSDAATRVLAQTATAISTYLGNLMANTIKGSFDIYGKWDEVQTNLRRMNIEKYKSTLQSEYESFLVR